MWTQGWIEIARYPAYLPDDILIDKIQVEPKFEYYYAENEGVLIETHAGSKSYFFNTKRKLNLNERLKKIIPNQ